MEQLLVWLNEERGRRLKLAEAIGINAGALSQWTQVPADRVIAVENFTGISRHELRPDLSSIFITPEPAPSKEVAA